MPTRTPQILPPLTLAIGALRVLWQNRDDALRLGLVPTFILFGGFVFGWDAINRYMDLMKDGQTAEIDSALMGRIIIVFLVSGIAGALIVVNWLRFLLLGPMSAVGLGLTLDRNHFGFFASVTALFIALGLALIILSMPLAVLPAHLSAIPWLVLVISLLVVFARLVFVPVSIAIGQPITPGRAWSATKRNGIRLALGLALVEIPFFVLLNLSVFVLSAIGFAPAAPYAMMFIAAAFQTAILVAQASVLAAAFRHLIGIEA